MKSIILEETELKERLSQIYREEQIKILQEIWNKISDSDKKIIFEFLKVIHPEKSKLINEATGWNTALDIAGIFDPTGAIDIYNGFSYWRQGDNLFAILSWISAVPYLGDAIAKPVVGALKIGGKTTKIFRSAVKSGNASRIARASSKSKVLKTFVEKSNTWGGKLLRMLRSIVGGYPFIKRLIPLVDDFVNLFKTASVELKTAATAGKEAEYVYKGFRGFKGVRNNWLKYITSDAPLWSKLNAGSFRLLGGNPATRSLMRRSKWYLGLLDNLGIVDTKTTPEELQKKIPDFAKRLDEYNRSDEAMANIQQDMSEEEIQQQYAYGGKGYDEPGSQKTNDIATKILSTIFPPLGAIF